MSSRIRLQLDDDAIPTTVRGALRDIFRNHFAGLMLLSILITLGFAAKLAIDWAFNTYIGMNAAVMEEEGHTAQEIAIQTMTLRVGQFALGIPALMLGALFMGAGAHVIRKWFYGEPTRLVRDFFREGFVQTWKSSLLGGFVLGLGILLVIFDVSYLDLMGFPPVATVILGIFQGLVLLFVLHMTIFAVASETVYKLDLWPRIKNSALFGGVLYLPSIGVDIITLALPVCYIVFVNLYFQIFCVLIFLFIGSALFVLIWFAYAQWAFHRYVNKRRNIRINNRDY